jgi:hypothetical protein
MYSAFIVFIVTAITLFLRSWILFTIPIVMSVIFKKLIKAEQQFPERPQTGYLQAIELQGFVIVSEKFSQ